MICGVVYGGIALSPHTEGIIVPDVKKVCEEGQWTCTKKNLAAPGRVAEKWMLKARFGMVLNNCFRTILCIQFSVSAELKILSASVRSTCESEVPL